MTREKIQHALTLFCASFLCVAFVFSVYRLSGVIFPNLIFLCIGLAIFLLERKKKKTARYVSGVVFLLAGLVMFFGFFNPMDGDAHDRSVFWTICVFVGSTLSVLAASLCLDPPGWKSK